MAPSAFSPRGRVAAYFSFQYFGGAEAQVEAPAEGVSGSWRAGLVAGSLPLRRNEGDDPGDCEGGRDPETVQAEGGDGRRDDGARILPSSSAAMPGRANLRKRLDLRSSALGESNAGRASIRTFEVAASAAMMPSPPPAPTSL